MGNDQYDLKAPFHVVAEEMLDDGLVRRMTSGIGLLIGFDGGAGGSGGEEGCSKSVGLHGLFTPNGS